MITKNEIKYIQSLSDKKNRAKEETFIAEGIKLVNELLESKFTVKKIYALPEWISMHKEVGNVVEISPAELEKISNQSTPNQVLAIVEKKKMTKFPVVEKKLTIVLDGIQDPGNLGTIIRIADWFGITQIVASADTADTYNPKVVQSTMGSIVRVDTWYLALDTWLEGTSVPVYGALLSGKSLYEQQSIQEGIIVVGNESKGIRENVSPFIQHAVTIPRKGKTESLNAAVATGIILSWLTR